MSLPLWLIPALPLAGFVVCGLLGKKLGKSFVSAVGVGSVGLATVAAYARLIPFAAGSHEAVVERLSSWITAGSFSADLSLRLDALSALMTSFVTFVGFWIHVYSIGYMRHDETDAGYARYFSYLNLFMFSMLTLVLAQNFLLLFVGWEGVGLCSYLLVGYYYDREYAAAAGKKAFVVNRIGDYGFLLGMFGIFSLFGSLDFDEVFGLAAAQPDRYAPWLTVVCLCLFVGAMGKSAQVPLYVWLPDAMAGPTPVSALIHAATMVTAGVYMVARSNVLFRLAPDALMVVAVIGGFTALFAATIGLAQNDIKKVLAYSTVSQLGYMFLACGVGAFVAGMFHVMTHAFFKACLFLGSGSVIHALSGEQDMRKMGGLSLKIGTTFRTFLIASLAIAGIPILAGFFSKDAILAAAYEAHFEGIPWLGKALWAAALFTAGLTAFYMFRLVSMTFFGTFRGPREVEEHIHESPRSMTVPLVILAFLSSVGGFVGVPIVHGGNKIGEFLSPILLPLAGRAEEAHHASVSLEFLLMVASVLVATGGILLAFFWYAKGNGAVPAALAAKYPGVYRAVLNKYYVDEVYEAVFVEGLAKGGGNLLWDFDVSVIDGAVNGVRNVTVAFSWIASFFDQYVVDGLVNGVANTFQAAFRLFRRAETGRVQNYALVMGGGLFAIVAAYLLFR